jgi:hypothetical protein
VRAATEQERAQLEQRLREIEERLQRQLGELRASQQRAVEQAAGWSWRACRSSEWLSVPASAFCNKRTT